MCLLEKKTGHKHLYQSDMQAWAFVPQQTYVLSLPCFLSSSHACKGLVNRLLPSLNLEIPYGDVSDAIDDWSKHHDSSPLEKGIQAAWDDFACRDTLNSLPNTKTLGTTVSYLLHKRVTLLPGQKCSQVPVLETCSVLMSSVLHSPSELVPKSLKAQNATAEKLLSWGSMACPVLKMQATSHGIQPSTPSSRGH